MFKEENNPADIAYIPSAYSKSLNNYSKFRIKFILPFLASISKTCNMSSNYPVYKLMKAVSKIFMLNQIQVIFLAYLIQETNWDIKDKTIYMNAENVQDIVCYSIDNIDYKRLILYLMITSYTVKYYLNQKTNQYIQEAGKRCPNFRQIFQNWAKKNSNITRKINPRTLNTVYKKLYSNTNKNSTDFNMMVDAIIQISPAYNPDKQSVKQEKKKVPKIVEQQVKLEEVMIKHEKSGFLPAAPLFSSSGLIGLSGNKAPNQGNSLLNPFVSLKNSGKNNGMMGSSVIGVPNNYEIKDEDDCQELMIGLQNGESEQNIVFDEKGQQQQVERDHYTSIINLNMSKNSLVDKIILEQRSPEDKYK